MKIITIIKLVTLAVTSMAMCSCDQQISTNDFLVTDKLVQEVSLTGISEIIVRCYCSETVEHEVTQSDKVKLKIFGTYSSVGYHGEQDKPISISDKLLAFKQSGNGTTLVLESQEYTFIHHAFLIEKLEIKVPNEIDFKFEKVEYEELEGRKIN